MSLSDIKCVAKHCTSLTKVQEKHPLNATSCCFIEAHSQALLPMAAMASTLVSGLKSSQFSPTCHNVWFFSSYGLFGALVHLWACQKQYFVEQLHNALGCTAANLLSLHAQGHDWQFEIQCGTELMSACFKKPRHVESIVSKSTDASTLVLDLPVQAHKASTPKTWSLIHTGSRPVSSWHCVIFNHTYPKMPLCVVIQQ